MLVTGYLILVRVTVISTGLQLQQ